MRVSRAPSAEAAPRREPSVHTFLGLHGPLITAVTLSLFFAGMVVTERGYFLLREDHVFESLTAALFLMASSLCALGALLRKGPGATRFWVLAWGVAFLVMGMEEISWGQRLFGVETPGLLESLNQQEEINLHNLDSHRVNTLLSVGAFAVGVGLPAAGMTGGRAALLLRRWRVVLPPPHFVAPLAVAVAFVEPGWMTKTPLMWAVLGLAFGFFAYVLAARASGGRAVAPRLPTSHAVAGLVGVALIPALLGAFEGRLQHESNPSEFKEFLFATLALIFAVWAAARLPQREPALLE